MIRCHRKPIAIAGEFSSVQEDLLGNHIVSSYYGNKLITGQFDQFVTYVSILYSPLLLAKVQNKTSACWGDYNRVI